MKTILTSTAILIVLGLLGQSASYKIALASARSRCDEIQQPNIEDYERRLAAGQVMGPFDPPSTYCPYLEQEQPDLLLKDYGTR